jgi:hypothetical protein
MFKPNAPLVKVVVMSKLGKNLTKQDHVIIVGGSEKSLERNCHSFENDLNFIAERT